MDKEKILRLCNEIKDIATEIQERTMKDSYIMAQTIINKVLVIATEISAKSKSNGDCIRQMTDEELSAFLGGIVDNCSYNTCDNCPMYGACVDVPLSRDKWLKQEVSEGDIQ